MCKVPERSINRAEIGGRGIVRDEKTLEVVVKAKEDDDDICRSRTGARREVQASAWAF